MPKPPSAPTERRRLLILGTHIFAEEITELVRQADTYEVAGYVENQDRTRVEGGLLGQPTHWIDDIEPLARDHDALCAIGTTERRAFIEQVAGFGFQFATVTHPSAVVAASSELGAGTSAGAGVIVGAQSAIGSHVILNRGVLVGHHTTIGSFVTVSPGANIAGAVSVGDGSYIGMGAIVLDRRQVGEGAVVAAGAVVTADVAPNTMVMGVPARVVREGVNGR